MLINISVHPLHPQAESRRLSPRVRVRRGGVEDSGTMSRAETLVVRRVSERASNGAQPGVQDSHPRATGASDRGGGSGTQVLGTTVLISLSLSLSVSPWAGVARITHCPPGSSPKVAAQSPWAQWRFHPALGQRPAAGTERTGSAAAPSRPWSHLPPQKY